MFRIFNLLMLSSTLVFTMAGSAMSQSMVSSAKWSKPISFKLCDANDCKTYKSIELDRKSIELGQSISITNLDNGEPILELAVTGINYSDQISMCWINNAKNNDFPSHITVGGCKR